MKCFFRICTLEWVDIREKTFKAFKELDFCQFSVVPSTIQRCMLYFSTMWTCFLYVTYNSAETNFKIFLMLNFCTVSIYIDENKKGLTSEVIFRDIYPFLLCALPGSKLNLHIFTNCHPFKIKIFKCSFNREINFRNFLYFYATTSIRIKPVSFWPSSILSDFITDLVRVVIRNFKNKILCSFVGIICTV